MCDDVALLDQLPPGKYGLAFANRADMMPGQCQPVSQPMPRSRKHLNLSSLLQHRGHPLHSSMDSKPFSEGRQRWRPRRGTQRLARQIETVHFGHLELSGRQSGRAPLFASARPEQPATVHSRLRLGCPQWRSTVAKGLQKAHGLRSTISAFRQCCAWSRGCPGANPICFNAWD